MIRDLRDWIERLRDAGELVEITAPVDPYLEITEITDRVSKRFGPALLFRNVIGSEFPVLINQFGSDRAHVHGRSRSTRSTSPVRASRS